MISAVADLLVSAVLVATKCIGARSFWRSVSAIERNRALLGVGAARLDLSGGVTLLSFHVTSLEGAPVTVAAKSAPLPAATFAVSGNIVISTFAGFPPTDIDERSIHTMPPTASKATITAPISTGEILLLAGLASASPCGAAKGTDA